MLSRVAPPHLFGPGETWHLEVGITIWPSYIYKAPANPSAAFCCASGAARVFVPPWCPNQFFCLPFSYLAFMALQTQLGWMDSQPTVVLFWLTGCLRRLIQGWPHQSATEMAQCQGCSLPLLGRILRWGCSVRVDSWQEFVKGSTS